MTRSTMPETAFASSEREHFHTINAELDLLKRSGPLLRILERVPVPVAVMNSCRQMVFVNNALLTLLSQEEHDSIIGLRIGEAFGCPNSTHDLGGCGTTEWCEGCGVTAAVVEALETGEARHRSEINAQSSGGRVNLAFDQTAYAFDYEGTRFVVVFMTPRLNTH